MGISSKMQHMACNHIVDSFWKLLTVFQYETKKQISYCLQNVVSQHVPELLMKSFSVNCPCERNIM